MDVNVRAFKVVKAAISETAELDARKAAASKAVVSVVRRVHAL